MDETGYYPRRGRAGVSLVELMVIVSIVGLLLALLLPAVQAARESGRRTSCLNNIREQGSAMLQFEETNARLPTGGEGTDLTQSPPATAFDLQSTFTQMLPYLEEGASKAEMDSRFSYNDGAWPKNQVAAKTVVPIFLCPSNALRQEDPNGYGVTDYMPTVYTDIDPTTGVRNTSTRMDGALRLGGTPTAKIIDGMSRTIALAEDGGRSFETLFPNTTSEYVDPVFSGGAAMVWNGTKQVTYSQWCASRNIVSGGLPAGESATPSTHRVMNRWAEPASASGVSGQANSTPAALIEPISGNASPAGGPPNCLWSQANCGPNEEIWSWHIRGSNVLMCDGSARFIGNRIHPVVLRKLVTADEQAPYNDNDVPD